MLVQAIRPMDAVVSGALSRPRFNLVLLSSFALVALSLSAVGIYGVLAICRAAHARDWDPALALGARAADVVRLVLGEGMAPVLAGVVVGLVTAGLATRNAPIRCCSA